MEFDCHIDDPVFVDFFGELAASSVEVLVVGGHAVRFYGFDRVALDLDLWVGSDALNWERACSAVRAAGYRVPPDAAIVPAGRLGAGIAFGVPPRCIELIANIRGVEFAACFARRVEVATAGVTVPYMSLTDLRIHKQAACRYRDLDDLAHLPLIAPDRQDGVVHPGR